jgi:hypothetical protein
MTRARNAWSALAPQQRLAALCALGLFVTMFLPWYSRETTAVVKGHLQTVSTTLIAWKAFSFVEAAILLVAVGVLVLLFTRAERKAFHLPGGDGLVILAAGTWVALLVFYRLIDNKTGAASDFQKVDYGVSWGIFVTLLCGTALAYSGNRLRMARLVEPEIRIPRSGAPTVADRRPSRRRERPPRDAFGDPAEPPPTTTGDPPTAATRVAPARREGPSEGPEVDGGTQLSFDEQE